MSILSISLILLFPLSGLTLNQCFISAGETYGIHPNILWAIAKNESGFNHTAINRNKNGTYDYGIMQINSSWYKTLGKENWQRLNDPCFNIYVGAWILRQCMDKYGYSWDAIACYAAGTPKKGRWYTWRIYNTLNSYTTTKNSYKTISYKTKKEGKNEGIGKRNF
ncbi:MAG TPA: lytic transglycosylase domain-containing protein [Caldisericia bacterium]|nr:lytic transglycosylase domain-containing protein [Caldisericia bacterium]